MERKKHKWKQYVEKEVNFISFCFLFFRFLSVSFVNLQHAQVLLIFNGEYCESCCCCCFMCSSYRLGGRVWGGDMPGHSRLRVSYLQYNFSFGQFYAPQSASFSQLSLSTIRTGSKIPYGFACRTAVATIERLCMQMRLTTTVGNGLNSTFTLCLPLFSRFCGTLGLCPYESYGPDYTLLALFVFVSLVLLAACLGSHAFCALLHTFVWFLLPILATNRRLTVGVICFRSL